MSEAAAFNKKDEIIALYQEGYSQKDISQRFRIPASDLRAVLQSAGFNTLRFRALDEDITSVIIHLISNGMYFKDIERICDISFHAIRDLVARNHLQRVSKRARLSNPDLIVPDDFTQNAAFAERYREGESFCSLCKDFELSKDEILYEFLSVTAEQVESHREALRKVVLDDVALAFSPTAIARRHGISLSVVRDMIAGHT